MEILLFGGTVEGRTLARRLIENDCAVTACVATEYGAELVPECPGLRVRAGRLDRGEMEALMDSRPFRWVVDATHPYAAQATENIRAAARAAGLPYLRLLRRAGREEDCERVRDLEQAARRLADRPGNILLTTGSKELAPFAAPGLVERCYPRVLPSVEAVGKCRELGFPPGHIIAMQGPFSRALNEALIDQFAIRTLVTKDSGDAGGFQAKAAAARATGCALLVVERPLEETGLTLEEIEQIVLKEARG